MISGNQMNGSISGKDKDGTHHEVKLRAKRASAELLAELSFWKSIKISTNPEDFKSYLERYPDGAFVEDAGARMRGLEALKNSPSPSPTPPNL
jgi:hypothetical protein